MMEIPSTEESARPRLVDAAGRESGLLIEALDAIPGTVSSQVYLVRFHDGTQAILKGSLWYQGFADDPETALERVYGLADALKQQGIPLQGARSLASGRFTFEFNGASYALLDYIEGEAFSATEKEFASAGAALGMFHQKGASLMNSEGYKKDALAIPFEMPYGESLAVYRNGLRETMIAGHACEDAETCAALAAHVPELDAVLAYIESALAPLTPRQTLLHNDFHASNGLYGKDGSFVGFLDVDQMGYGDAVSDVGNTLVSLVAAIPEEAGKIDVEKRVAAFLRAYHRVYALSLEEYVAAPAAGMRWDALRVLRSTRRHHTTPGRLNALHKKSPGRVNRLRDTPAAFVFMDAAWIAEAIA